MELAPVTDPAILGKLSGLKPVEDPKLLSALNGESPKESPKVDTVDDVAQSIFSGLPKGLSNIVGIFGDLQGMRDHAIDYMLRKGIGAFTGREMPSTLAMVQPDQLPNTSDVRGVIEDVAGKKLYEPQTTAGKFAGSITEGATSMPVGGVPSLLTGAAVGAGSEAGGQLTEKIAPGNEVWGRLIGGLLTGGMVALARSFVNTPEAMIQKAVESVPEGKLREADALIQQSIAKGTPITGPEAIAQVTGGNPQLTNVQRVVEQSSGGAPVMSQTMGARPAANAAAFEAEAGRIAPQITAPAEIAPRVQAAADSAVQDQRNITNALSKPAYDATANNPNAVLSSKAFAAVKKNRAFAEAIKEVRSNPIKYGDLAGMGDDALPVLDAAQKYLKDVADKATVAGEKFASSNAGKMANDLTSAIDAEFPRYASARNIQAFRQSYIEEPFSRAPTGLLSAAEKFPKQASIVFDPKPLPGSEKALNEAIKTVSVKDPEAAREFVRAHLEKTFTELNQRLSGGPNQFGGAGFAAEVSGNSQQAKNLKAVLEGLPNGAEVSKSFFNLLKIFEAQGMRARPNSATAFNQELQQALSTGGPVSEAVAMATSPAKLVGKGGQVMANFNAGQNARNLAEIFTSPDTIEQMRNIGKILPDSRKAQALFSAIVSGQMATEGQDSK